MNVFSLFENENVEDIKLALKVVKCLNLQKEFELYFNKPFVEYEVIFNNFVLVANKNENLKNLVGYIIKNKLDLSILTATNISWILKYQPQLIDFFDLTKFYGWDIFDILERHPQLIDRLDLSQLDNVVITNLLRYRPQLASYFNK